jgi:hypothetical protein
MSDNASGIKPLIWWDSRSLMGLDRRTFLTTAAGLVAACGLFEATNTLLKRCDDQTRTAGRLEAGRSAIL